MLPAAGGFLVLVGLAFLNWGWTNAFRRLAASRWPKAHGAVLESRVWSDETGGSPGSFHARVRYEYWVEGQRHISSTIEFGRPHLVAQQAECERIASTYPVGSRVVVHYDPHDPQIAALEAGQPSAALSPLALGLAIASVGAWLVMGSF
jgi:hypothetical protein